MEDDDDSELQKEEKKKTNNFTTGEGTIKNDVSNYDTNVNSVFNTDTNIYINADNDDYDNGATSMLPDISQSELRDDHDLGYSLYICPYLDEFNELAVNTRKISKLDLEKLIKNMNPSGDWNITTTSCGLIVSFSQQKDMLSVLKQNLPNGLKGPVQVAQFSTTDVKYRQSVMIKDVPWAIPLKEISEALNKQGVTAINIERIRNMIRVELNDPMQYENLLRSGFDFLGVARFPVVSGRWRFPPIYSPFHMEPTGVSQDLPVQCFRCQGFWHIAANCRQPPRCVRCGDQHTVEFCPRPRQNPICCHCSGPHHAAYRHCPVRIQHLNSTPVSLTISTAHCNSNSNSKLTNLQK